MVSRVLGLVRDVVVAKYFDAAHTDIFYVALRIPNTFRRVLGEGGFANAFVPVLSETKVNEPNDVHRLLANVFGVLFVVLCVLTFIGVVFAGVIMALGFGGNVDDLALGTLMLRITFPYILFISLTVFFSEILKTYGKFALPAFTPALLNVSLVGFAWLGRDWFEPPILALAVAVFIGGVLQLLIQLPLLKKLGLLVVPKPNFRAPKIRQIGKLMLPTLLGSSAGQINALLNGFLAANLTAGSVTWLYYADRLVELPVAIIGVALAAVVLPKLSTQRAQNDTQQYQYTLTWAAKTAFVVGTAATTGLFVLAEPLISLLFERGKFDALQVAMTAKALKIYAFSAFAFVMVKAIVPAFYAQKDTRTPMLISVATIVVNIVLSIALFRAWGHVGLAFASTVAAMLNASILATLLIRANWLLVNRETLAFMSKILSANILMGFTLAILCHWLVQLQLVGIVKVLSSVTLVIFGMLCYLVALVGMRVNLRELLVYKA